jgi:DNA invertase Pin-like site-specific DNA recombinase
MRAKITADHLERTALVYVRQSTPGQVRGHLESQRRQYALADVARELGFERVETIDDDLGISGSGFAERPGFQRLLTTVSSGAAGAVLALEASRLARNDRDWSQLVELGAIARIVLIDHDGIYDPRLVNDRLLLGLKGIMSDFEMATLRQRALEAQRTKAQRGELWMHLPVGLVYGPTGVIELDPDVRMQQAIRLVLQKFDELGSIRQVLLWLRREGRSVPVTHGGKHGRYTEWASPNYTRVHAIVTSPFLAGAYVYGKSESRTTIVDGRIRRTSGHDLAVDQWQVVIPDHHPGYLDWASYLRHLSMIESNAYMKPGARKSARGGRSLLAGLLRCRRCGHTLQISYSGRDSTSPNFRCLRRHHQTGSEACVSCSGKSIEEAVSRQILQAIETKTVDAATRPSAPAKCSAGATAYGHCCAPCRMRTTKTRSPRTVYTTMYGNGARTSSRVPSRFPGAIRKCEKCGGCVVNAPYQFLRPIGRVYQQVIGNAFEVVCSFFRSSEAASGMGLFACQMFAEARADFFVAESLAPLDLR